MESLFIYIRKLQSMLSLICVTFVFVSLIPPNVVQANPPLPVQKNASQEDASQEYGSLEYGRTVRGADRPDLGGGDRRDEALKRRVEPKALRVAVREEAVLEKTVREKAVREKARRLDREVRKRLKPGLVVRFRQSVPTRSVSTASVATDTVTDVRRVRRAALSVGANESVSSRLGAGPFSFTMSGYLRSRLKGKVRFWVEGPGEVSLTIDGNPVEIRQITGDDLLAPKDLPGVTLARGYNQVEIRGDVSGRDDYRFRLLWSSDDVLPEPIPSAALLFDSQDPELSAADEWRGTRLRFASLRCVRCHSISDAPASSDEMPELSLDAPRLEGLGTRVYENWVAHWLSTPRDLRAGASMPHLLPPSAEGRDEAVHLAAFVTSLRDRPPEANGETTDKDAGSDHKVAIEEGVAVEGADQHLIDQGLELYETRGCMACHRFTVPTDEDAYDRISLYFTAEKFRPRSLADFLQQPHKNYRSIRMPDFGFDAAEATAIAAYIRSQSIGKLNQLTDTKPDPALGAKLFTDRRCGQCHDGVHVVLARVPLGTLFQAASRRGCLAEDVALRGTAPDFGLNDRERLGLVQFLQGSDRALRVRVRSEIAMRTMARLRCRSCHDDDGDYSSLPDITADEGELGLPYERIPNLGRAGGKLQSDWIRRQVSGTLGYRSRPWLKMRMPAFPNYAKLLSRGLAAEHGVAVAEKFTNVTSEELVASGQALSTKEKGFDCLQCHSLEEDFIELENKANGVGLSYVTDRLRKDFYHRWIRDPLRIDPLTKMPKFTTDGVTSQRTEYFDGDAQKQFEALWQYMRQLESSRESLNDRDES